MQLPESNAPITPPRLLPPARRGPRSAWRSIWQRRKCRGCRLGRRWYLLLILTGLTVTTTVAAGEIFQCIDEQGQTVFTDLRYCHSSGARSSAKTAAPIAGTIAGLTPAEQVALAELEPRLRAQRKARQQATKREQAQLRKQRIRSRATRAKACEQATRQLTHLRARKRAGYRARQARQLDLRERELKAQKRASC